MIKYRPAFVVFSHQLDRVALGMSLSSARVQDLREIAPNVWAVRVGAYDSRSAFATMFSHPATEPGGWATNGLPVIVADISSLYGFAPDATWKIFGLNRPPRWREEL